MLSDIEESERGEEAQDDRRSFNAASVMMFDGGVFDGLVE